MVRILPPWLNLSYQPDITCEVEGPALAHHCHIADKISVARVMRGTLHLEAQRVSIVLIKYHEGLFRQNRTVGRVAGQRINEEIAPQESNECCAVNNNTCPLGCFSPTFAFLFSSSHSVCVLCDLIHPHCIDVDEIMISKIYIFNLDLASEFQPHTSSVN